MKGRVFVLPDDLSTRGRHNSPAALLTQLRHKQFSLRGLVVPAIGLAASVCVSLAVGYWNIQADDREFNAVANNHRQILSDGLRKYEDKIVALRALFDAAGHEIGRKEFEVFADELVADGGAIEALSWIPRVGRDDRAAFELGAVKGGLAGYHITSFALDGKPASSEEREEYFPILYSVVPSGATPIYGMDLGSEPMRHKTLDRARDTGSFFATPILELKTGAAGRHGFFIVLPVFRQGLPQEKVEDRQRNLMGFVQGVFQLAPLVESILHSAAAPERMDLYVFPGGANGDALPLHIHSSRLRTTPAEPRSLGALEAGTYWSGELAIAGVRLAMVAVPFSSRGAFMRNFGALAILAMGLVLTGLNQFYITRQRRAESALVESEGRLNAIFGAAADGIAIAEADTKRVRMVNASICRMLGYSREEMLELSVTDLHSKEDLPHVVEEFERNAAEETNLMIELPVRRKDGSIFFAQASTSPVMLGGKPCLMAIFRDVTDARAARENLNQAHQQLLSSVAELQRHEREMRAITEMNDNLQACNSRHEAYLIAAATANDLFPGTNGALAVVASRMLDVEVVAHWGSDQEMLPYFVLDDCWALRTGQMREVDGAGKGAVCRHFKSTPSGPYLCLPLTVHGETTGLLYLNLAAGGAINEDVRRLVLLFGDVIKLSLSNLRLRDTLREQATRDPLTGLFNRRYLDETLARELSHAARRKEPLSVAMLDIDHFKMFNDENGHEAGDEVLKAVGEILKDFTRATDIACRFGGEEFILVLSGADSSVALPHVEQICQEIKRKQVAFRGKRLSTVTVSAGLVQAPENGASPEEMLRAADKALYAAKSAGRDRVVTTSLAD